MFDRPDAEIVAADATVDAARLAIFASFGASSPWTSTPSTDDAAPARCDLALPSARLFVSLPVPGPWAVRAAALVTDYDLLTLAGEVRIAP